MAEWFYQGEILASSLAQSFTIFGKAYFLKEKLKFIVILSQGLGIRGNQFEKLHNGVSFSGHFELPPL